MLRNWETIKREQEGRTDPLAGIPSALPALQFAAKLQKRAADAGLAAPARDDPLAAVRRALEEADAADAPERRERALGELLFAVVALARERDVEPETALRRTARRFRASARSEIPE